MSPRIGTSIAVSAFAEPQVNPRQKARAAILAAESQRIRVRPGDYSGVKPCAHTPLKWCVDRQRGKPTVDLIGAILLLYQPDSQRQDREGRLVDVDELEAAAEALALCQFEVSALAKGFSDAPLSSEARGALSCYAAGLILRGEFTRECRCGGRVHKDDACERCG